MSHLSPSPPLPSCPLSPPPCSPPPALIPPSLKFYDPTVGECTHTHARTVTALYSGLVADTMLMFASSFFPCRGVLCHPGECGRMVGAGGQLQTPPPPLPV